MDLNGDGNIDILSGSYSRKSPEMAGLFQVLWGVGDGAFKPAEVLNGVDSEPLIITSDEKAVTDRICTRPTAADLNGDGKLDIVAGNFTGTFAFFVGEGNGKFAQTSTMLTGADGKHIKVGAHSDPCLVDFDADGDLDLVSGSSDGGVRLFVNAGTKTKPAFSAAVELLPGKERRPNEELRYGDDHLRGPSGDSRVWVDDLNSDGKLDLIIGDATRLEFVPDGIDEAESRKRFAAWKEREAEIRDAMRDAKTDEERKAVGKKARTLWEERAKAIRTDATGFVWVAYGK